MYIDGIGSFLFEKKKVAYSTVPFFVGSYKFSRVKNAIDFFKQFKYFRFSEMNFHRNDSEGKVVDYCTKAGVHFEYTNFWDKDEETFRNARNMTALRKIFKKKIATVEGKGKVANKLKRQEENASNKRQE